MATNFKNIPARLLKRAESHQAKLEAKKDGKVATHEKDDNFSIVFDEAHQTLNKTLGECATVQKERQEEHFDFLKFEFQKLQKYLSDCSPFLSSHKIRNTQQHLTALQAKISDLQTTYLPKKIFTFRAHQRQNDVQKLDILVDSSCVSLDNCVAPKSPQIINMDNECGFSDLKDKNLKMTSEEINYKDVSLNNLKGCRIELYGAPCTLHISQLVDCVVLSGPVTTSVFFEDCSNCTFAMACQQIRVHSTLESKFYLHVIGYPIIEDCSDLRFSPYNWSYDNMMEHVKLAKLDWTTNNWNQVKDFNWLAPEESSPNWSVLPEAERIADWNV